MDKDSLIQVLEKHPFTEELQPHHLELLADLARETCFERDAVIFHENEECSEFFLIVSGRVAVEIEAPDHTLRVQTLGAGDELGWSAILVGRGKYFQARALERSMALAFDGPALIDACRHDTGFGFALMYRMLGVVSERLQRTRLQLLDMYSPAARRAGN